MVEYQVMRGSLLQQRCELEFERYVADIYATEFDELGMACIPVPWSRSGVGMMKAGIPQLICDVRIALDAKVWFDEYGPDWAKPLPMGQEKHSLLRARGALHLLGLYANSLERSEFDYRTHPPIDVFACGVMAHPHAPDHVRYDPELQAEFSARELPGLCNRLVWSVPATHSLPR